MNNKKCGGSMNKKSWCVAILSVVFCFFTANATYNKRQTIVVEGLQEQIKKINRKHDQTLNESTKEEQKQKDHISPNQHMINDKNMSIFDLNDHIFEEKKHNLDVHNSTTALLEIYRSKLSNLQEGCLVKKAKESCYAVGTIVNAQKDIKEVLANINFGYGINDNLSLGANFARSLSYNIPKNYAISIRKDHYLNSGIYAYLHTISQDNKYWYIKPSVAFGNGYDIDINKSKIITLNENNKVGQGKINGYSMMLKGGQNITLDNNIVLDWHIGVGHINISRNDYTENNKEKTTVIYEQGYNNNKLAYFGAKINIPIIQKVQWSSGVEVEHEFNKSLSNNLDYIDQSQPKNKLLNIKGTAYSTLTYSLSNNIKVSFTTNINRNASKSMILNGIVNFTGNF